MKNLPKASASSHLLILLAFLTSISLLTLLVSISISLNRPSVAVSPFASPPTLKATTVEHIAFGVASSRRSWPRRRDLVRLWWDPRLRGCVFLDDASSDNLTDHGSAASLPPICVSGDTSGFPYTYRNGFRPAIRIARLVKETVELNLPGVRWFVFGDDDTIFLPGNLAKTLSKYNHDLWYYIGGKSEVYEQNRLVSFGTAFGGGGFAISAPLAKVLARVLDSCIRRYQHLYGSDIRISSCLAELGVGFTHEPGFHQMDVKGDAFGVMASHPLTPLVSLHHIEHTFPIFPNMSHLGALGHLFRAVEADPERILQQTVCYDHWFGWTISVSWGYAVQVFDHHLFLPDALRVQETFSTWKTNRVNDLSNAYMFDTMPVPVDPCQRPTVLFFDGVDAMTGGLSRSRYRRMVADNCTFDPIVSPKKISEVVVISPKSNIGIEKLQAPRRQCCDVLPPASAERLEIAIRECKEDELTYTHP